MNSQAVFAENTGIIILGGGLCKHHICNANLMVRMNKYLFVHFSYAEHGRNIYLSFPLSTSVG